MNTAPKPERGYIPDGPFDAAAWLEIADRQGLDVYLWVIWDNEKKGPVDAWATDYLEPPYDEPVDLSGWIGTGTPAGEGNAAALCDYMRRIGRFGPRRYWQQFKGLELRRFAMDIRREQLHKQLVEWNAKQGTAK